MKFGYTIIYVEDVNTTLAFYEKAFGFKLRFVDGGNQYGELETGDTALAFASEQLAESAGIVFSPNRKSSLPAGFIVALVTDSVDEAYVHACECGAIPVQEPQEMPWTQRVAYVRDLNDILVELCSPIS